MSNVYTFGENFPKLGGHSAYRKTLEAEDIPVVSGYLFGWRAFLLRDKDGGLISPVQQERWWTDHRVAKCRKRQFFGGVAPFEHSIESPDERCSCGLYLYSRLSDLIRNEKIYFGYYFGSSPTHRAWCYCRIWGKVVIADAGFRAQRLQIVHVFTDAPATVRNLGHKTYPDVLFNSNEHLLTFNHKMVNQTIDLGNRTIPAAEMPSEVMRKYIKGHKSRKTNNPKGRAH